MHPSRHSREPMIFSFNFLQLFLFQCSLLCLFLCGWTLFGHGMQSHDSDFWCSKWRGRFGAQYFLWNGTKFNFPQVLFSMNQRQNLWTSIFRSVQFSRFKLRLVESMARAIFVFLSMITYASCCSTESQGCLINRVSIFSAQFVYLMCSIFNAL